MIIRTSWHWIITSCVSQRRRCSRLCRRPVFSGPSSRWSWWFTRPDQRISQHLCTSFECVPRQSLNFSMIICLMSIWNASHHSGPDATLRRQQQVFICSVHTAYPDRFNQALSNFPALILSASAIFAMTTSPNGTNADSYRQPLVLSYGVCFVL